MNRDDEANEQQREFEKFVEDFLLGTARDSLPWFTERDAKLERQVAANNKKKPLDEEEARRLAKTRKEIDDDRQAVGRAINTLQDRMVRFRWISNKLSADDKREFVFAIWGAIGAAFEIGMKANASNSAKAFTRSSTGKAAGERSGTVRLESRPWPPVVKEMSISIRAEDPSLSQDKLATEIEFRWKLDDVKPPGHDTIKSYVQELEASGELPRADKTTKKVTR